VGGGIQGGLEFPAFHPISSHPSPPPRKKDVEPFGKVRAGGGPVVGGLKAARMAAASSSRPWRLRSSRARGSYVNHPRGKFRSYTTVSGHRTA